MSHRVTRWLILDLNKIVAFHDIGNRFAHKSLTCFGQVQTVFADHSLDKTVVFEAFLSKIDELNRKLSRYLFHQHGIHFLITIDLLHIA